MMKNLFLAVALLAVAASCSQNKEVSMPLGDSIGFSTLNNRVTKAANTNADNSNSDYKVYAKSSVTTDPAAWLINEVIASNDSIKSGNIYYWPQSPATVDFYAYAPAIGVTEGTIEVGTSIPLTFTVPDSANIDFTVAIPVMGAKSTETPETDGNGEVQLKFAHMLSKASLEVSLEGVAEDSENNTSIAKNHTFTFETAEFTVAKNSVVANAASKVEEGNKPVATAGGTTNTYSYNFFDTDGSTKLNESAAKSFTSSNSLLFAPKAASATGYSITLTGVKIMLGSNPIFSGDLTYDIPEDTLFEQGKAYNFVVTVNGLTQITFESTEDDWTPATSGTNIALD